jgi:hypothetical protein
MENNHMTNYRVGDRIEHWPFGVAEAKRIVRVTGRMKNVKNGRPGFDGVTDSGLTVWGYDSEVKQVLPAYSADDNPTAVRNGNWIPLSEEN